MNGRFLFGAALVCAVLASAVGSVYVHHLRRAAFVELQSLERQRDELQIQWGRLQLEHSTWAQHERVEDLAKEKLSLYVPSAADVVVLVAEPPVRRND